MITRIQRVWVVLVIITIPLPLFNSTSAQYLVQSDLIETDRIIISVYDSYDAMSTTFYNNEILHWQVFWGTWNGVLIWDYNLFLQVYSSNDPLKQTLLENYYSIQDLKNDFTINLSDFPPGFYTIDLTASREEFVSQQAWIDIQILEQEIEPSAQTMTQITPKVEITGMYNNSFEATTSSKISETTTIILVRFILDFTFVVLLLGYTIREKISRFRIQRD